MEKMDFYCIKLNKNKSVYLRAMNNGFKWDKLDNAIYWQTWRDAKKFGENYFKSYNDWIIEEVLVEL